MEETQVVRALAALAQASRLQVFRLLVVAGPAGLTPGRMAAELGVPGATLSFHLKELTHAELVTQERPQADDIRRPPPEGDESSGQATLTHEREGRHLIYRARFDHMNDLLAYLTTNCCRGQACSENTAAACAC